MKAFIKGLLKLHKLPDLIKQIEDDGILINMSKEQLLNLLRERYKERETR